ncbi:MAG: sulfatase [Acidobacteria bacterium]|nr:sulfatase [Acidobacteriota bacterium]
MSLSRRALLASLLPPERPNVLFITVDDLRPQLGCYGDRVVKSPHIDRLAARGVTFDRAYCQMALCSPSRTSFLTGLRPDTTRVYDLTTHFRSTVPDAVTLPQLYKNNGYYAHGIYKVFHLTGTVPAVGNMNDAASWSDPQELPVKPVYGPEGMALLEADMEVYRKERAAGTIRPIRSLATERTTVADHDLSDGEVAQRAMAFLRKRGKEPFFLGVGFYKPHLPFVAPSKYWDLYRREDLRLPDNRFTPRGAPPYSVVDTSELRHFTDIPKEGPITEELGRKLLHGYLASISYVDAQVGLVLNELDRLGLREKTVVVLLGDNGYQIGEHDMWGRKHTNFETSARVPLLIAPPRFGRGFRSGTVVELLDVYPTVAGLCGLKPPANIEGEDLRRAMAGADVRWQRAAYTQYPRGKRMGRSVTDGRYRYTEWSMPEQAPEAIELYDHSTDPEENVNVAGETKYARETGRLSRLLHRKEAA